MRDKTLAFCMYGIYSKYFKGGLGLRNFLAEVKKSLEGGQKAIVEVYSVILKNLEVRDIGLYVAIPNKGNSKLATLYVVKLPKDSAERLEKIINEIERSYIPVKIPIIKIKKIKRVGNIAIIPVDYYAIIYLPKSQSVFGGDDEVGKWVEELNKKGIEDALESYQLKLMVEARKHFLNLKERNLGDYLWASMIKKEETYKVSKEGWEAIPEKT